MAHRLVEHTADIAIEADGDSRAAVLEEAALALGALVTGLDDIRTLGAEQEMRLRVEAPDLEALVVAWLSELLWHLDGEGLLWTGGGIEISEADGLLLEAQGNAVRYRTEMGQGVEVKAVTYHDLAIQERAGAWHLHVVVDI